MKKLCQTVALPFEGGHYGLTDAEGNQYLPMEMPPQLRRAGVKVHCEMAVENHMESFINWGVPVRIISFTIA